MATEHFLTVLATHLGKKVVDHVVSTYRPKVPKADLEEHLSAALSTHLTRLANWSEHIQMLRMSVPTDVDSETLPLRYSPAPRKFQNREKQNRPPVDEGVLFGSSRHVLLLGAPGAGKTTTLKRVARHMLQGAPSNVSDSTQFPMLVRLRALNSVRTQENPLFTYLASELGLAVSFETSERSAAPKIAQNSRLAELTLSEGQSIPEAVSAVINQLSVTLLLDGLDEVNGALREHIESDISELIELNRTCRLFITCRTGDYRTTLPSVNVFEVCDLGEDDVRALANVWLDSDANAFLSRLQTHASLRELAGRPLFLAHMLNIQRLGGYLPAQPCEIYELVTLLLIREWDRERGVVRRSAYADFGAEAKLRFLAAIAYEFTYVSKVQSFTHHDLEIVYSRICPSFGLPAEQAESVANELETHTGIIVEAGYRSYEFSHLTIQEYLTAHYLVRTRFAESRLDAYLSLFPSPLAIATALSSEPTAWLASILLAAGKREHHSSHSISSFLARLELENPRFIEGDALGYCVLALCFRYTTSKNQLERRDIDKYLAVLVRNESARRSFVEVVTTTYSLTAAPGTDLTFLARRRAVLPSDIQDSIRADLPKSGAIDRAWIVQNFIGRGLIHSDPSARLQRG